LLSFGCTIGWSIYQHRQLTRGRLHVTANLGYLTGYRLMGLSLSATNEGAVPVTLGSVVIDIPRAKETLYILVQSPAPLPHLLTPGASWMGFADIDEIQRQVASRASGRPPWKVQVSVKDAVGRKYKAPRLSITPRRVADLGVR
jgi:hypothetical protein